MKAMSLALLLTTAGAAVAEVAPSQKLRPASTPGKFAPAREAEDPRSLSVGRPSRGRIRRSAALPASGAGFRMLRQDGGRNYGTEKLILGLRETAALLAAADPDIPPLTIGDISKAGGGKISGHKSHQSGRDADIVFFWTDRLGRPAAADAFVHFDAQGRSRGRRPPVLFDVKRNWALVRALLRNKSFGKDVLYLFVSRHIRELLLEYARATQQSPALVKRAAAVMGHKGRGVGLHDNHFHLRIACSGPESAAGCRED